jgi:two-component system cell cycle sensor histidine kinase/response regulator CckA
MHTPKKLLFVDDDDVIVMLAATTLRRAGVAVDSFTDPRAAIDAFASAPDDYDIVVSDVRLGELDAFEMCAEMLRIRPHVRIVLTSGLVRPEDLENARAFGIGEVHAKSHIMTRLPELLERLRI